MKLGEYRFLKIFEGTGAWGSALPFEAWRKPYKFMGPVNLNKRKVKPVTRINVSVERIELEDDNGRTIPGIIVGCDECSAHVSVYGTSIRSVKRGCVMLKEQCGAGNYYVYEGDDFDD